MLHVLPHVPFTNRYCEGLHGTLHIVILSSLPGSRGGLHVALHVRSCGSQNGVGDLQGELQ